MKGTGKKQLVVAPLQGRGTKGPELGGRAGGSRRSFMTFPTDPANAAWPVEIADSSLHTIHNLQLVDIDGDRRDEIVVAAWEGVFVLDRDPSGHWTKTKIGTGNQEARAVQRGKRGQGRPAASNGSPFVATIEPWHGFQVVVYTHDPETRDAARLWCAAGDRRASAVGPCRLDRRSR